MIDFIRNCSKKELLLGYLAFFTVILLIDAAWLAWRGRLQAMIKERRRLQLTLAVVTVYVLPLALAGLAVERVIEGRPRDKRQ